MNTAPKLHEAIETLRKYRNNGSVRIWDMDAALDVVLSAIAPPSGEGVEVSEAVEIQSSGLVGEFAMGQFAIDMGNGVVRVVGIEFARGWNEARLAMRDHIYTATPQSAPSGEAVAEKKARDYLSGYQKCAGSCDPDMQVVGIVAAVRAVLIALQHTSPQSAPEDGLTFDAFRAANVSRCVKWHPEGIASWSPSDWLTAVTGELGELASLLKMRNRERDGLPGNKFSPTDKMVADELADVLTYLDLLAAVLGVDLGRAAVEKFNEVSERVGFPDRINVPTTPPPASQERGDRQRVVHDWCVAAFGDDHAKSIEQRGIRLVEEAIEAGQASGCDPAMVHRLVDHIYSKPAGQLFQEMGGVGVTLLALAEAAGLDADNAEQTEIKRVLSKPLEHFAARNAAKNAAGFNVLASPPSSAAEHRLEMFTKSPGLHEDGCPLSGTPNLYASCDCGLGAAEQAKPDIAADQAQAREFSYYDPGDSIPPLTGAAEFKNK